MTVSQKQFEHLTAMGVELWQRKALESIQQASTSETQLPPLTISLDTLKNSQLFNDLVKYLCSADSEVTQQDNQLNVGLLTWQFCPENQLSFADNLLTTPSIERLSQSTEMKLTLWHLLVKYNISQLSQ